MICPPKASRTLQHDSDFKLEFPVGEDDSRGQGCWEVGAWVKAEPQTVRKLDHLSSCDSDQIQSDILLAFQEDGVWADQGTFLPQDSESDFDFRQFSSYDYCPQQLLGAKPFLGDLVRIQEASTQYELLPESICPAAEGLDLVKGEGPGRVLKGCNLEESAVEIETGECCDGSPCSHKGETLNLSNLQAEVDPTMDGIIEALMLQHSPYSPHKRPLFEPPTPASCPADALPLPGLLVEVPPPLERLEPLRDPSRDLSPAAEPPQIDDLGASLEKLPQLKCSVKLETQEETPRQRGSRSRSKRVRKETARAFSSSPPASRVCKKRRTPSPCHHPESGSGEDEGEDCLEKKTVTVTASGRRVHQLLLLQKDHRLDAPESENNRCKNHKPWTIEETTALVWGVEKMGGGRWAEIKKLDCPETESLERRTAVDLKDKWRNLQNAIDRVTCDKKKGELSRELVDRIHKMRGACNTKARGDSRKISPTKHGRKRKTTSSRVSTPRRQKSQEWLP